MELSKKEQNERQYLGKYVTIGHLADEPTNDYDGRRGQVKRVDDRGQLWGTWGGLAIIPEVDDFEVNYDIPENEEFVDNLNEAEDASTGKKDASTNKEEKKDASTGKKEAKTAQFNDPYAITMPLSKNIVDIIKDCQCKLKNGKSKTQIVAKDWEEILKVIEKLKNSGIFKQNGLGSDSTQGITLTKVSKSSLNDSINEGEAYQPQYVGDFVTEYIYSDDDPNQPSQYDFDQDGEEIGLEKPKRDLNSIEYNAAKNHVRYLTSRGIKVEIVSGRWSTKLYIHYEGKEQYEAFRVWAAWHLGFTDVIAKRVPLDVEDEVDEMIARGNSTIY